MIPSGGNQTDFILAFSGGVKADSGRIAVKAARIFLGNGLTLENGLLLIENGKIVKTGTNISIPETYTLNDFGKLSVMPGLVDSHTHIGELPFPDNLGTSDFHESSQTLTPMVDLRDAGNFWIPRAVDQAHAP